MRRLPARRSTTSPASFNTFKCWETAERVTGNSAASSPTARARSARLSKIARRVASARAVHASGWLAMTNRKLQLTDGRSTLACAASMSRRDGHQYKPDEESRWRLSRSGAAVQPSELTCALRSCRERTHRMASRPAGPTREAAPLRCPTRGVSFSNRSSGLPCRPVARARIYCSSPLPAVL
jgi:hypothetical protein